MSEPERLDLDIVLDFQAEQLALFGGPDGIRDLGLLESALARPVNKFAYFGFRPVVDGRVRRPPAVRAVVDRDLRPEALLSRTCP